MCGSTSLQPAAFSSALCMPQHIRQLARSGGDNLGQAFFMVASHFEGGGGPHFSSQAGVVNVPVALATHLAPSQAYLGGAPQKVPSELCPTESTRVTHIYPGHLRWLMPERERCYVGPAWG